MKRALLIGLALILLAGTVAWAEEGVGAFAEFRGGVDARAMGMGGAFVAIADSYSATYWNPAGVALAGGPRVGGMYTNKFMADINFNYISGIMNIGGLSVAGTYMGMSTSAPASDGSIINWNSMMFSGTVAMNIAGIGFAGGTVKSYSASAAGASASGFGFDAGLLVTMGGGISIGAAAFDIGDSRVNWSGTPTNPTDTVPAVFRLGAAYYMDGLVFAAEYDFGSPTVVASTMRAGAELDLDVVRIRGGVVMPEGGELSFTAGAGLNLAPLYVDFAWVQNKQIQGEGVGDTLVLSAEFVF